MNRLPAWLLTLFFLFPSLSIASQATTTDYPSPKGFVSDYVGVLTTGERQTLENLCRDIQRQAKLEIAFVIMDTLPGGNEISQYATDLAHHWGVGQAGADRGALVLYKLGLSDNKRQIQIATGYGIEGELPDAKAGRILDRITIPYLRQNRTAEGLTATALAILDAVAPGTTIEGHQRLARGMRNSEDVEISPFGLIFMILLVVLMLSTRTGRAILFGIMLSGMFGGRRGGWGSGGGFGGGFGGFGGGGFGGGGAGRSF